VDLDSLNPGSVLALVGRDELTKEEYMRGGQEQTTLNHFYEKLLKLKNMMKTEVRKWTGEGSGAI
jgi:uncharacterized protein